MMLMFRPLALVVLLFAAGPAAAAPAPGTADRQRYESCLNLANLNPAAALGTAIKWVSERGGPPAQHCQAVALVGLKRYAEAAEKLDALGHAPGMGALRPELFDQAGNAWILQGEIDKAVASFQAALTLSAGDADLYADLARAQAMQADWPEVESDLNAALSIAPRRADLLLLRASARHAQNHIADARADVDSALKLSPKNADGMVERGSLKRDSGDLPGARQDFQAALALDPGTQTQDAARRNLAALDAAAKGLTSKTLAAKPVLKKK